jgi:NAD(P)H dehydrogenase (quinone)
VVLLEDGHIGQVYELAGDASLGYADLAAAAGEALGRDVAYVPVSREDFVAALQGSGLDAGTAEFVASMEDGIRGGVLADTDGTLSRLIGRPTTPVVDTFRAALAG